MPTDQAHWRCVCGETYLQLSPGSGFHRSDIDRQAVGLWRYAKALPVAKSPRVSIGEGRTPLIRGQWAGNSVYFKLDFLMPTGSFKDRGSAVMVTHLIQRQVQALVEDSSGNAGASIAAYAAASGIACTVFVPQTASPAKIAQVLAAGAEIVRIAGTRNDVAEAAMASSKDLFYASHNKHPFYLEGTKTLAFELWEDFNFEVPDNIVVPLGGGSNLLGCYLGFQQLLLSGEIGKLPRLFGIQAARCAPIYTAFASAAADVAEVNMDGTSIAEGVLVTKPARGAEALSAIRRTGGAVCAVDEEEISVSLLALARSGLFVEPTSALAAAGLSRLYAQGLVERDSQTVLVLTGSGLKSPAVILDMFDREKTMVDRIPNAPSQ